jgi:hypothetical protein
MSIGAFNPASNAMWSPTQTAQDRQAAKPEYGFAKVLEVKTPETKTPAPAVDTSAVGIDQPEPDRLPFIIDGEDISDLPVTPPEEGPSPQVLLMQKLFFGQAGGWMIDPIPDGTYGAPTDTKA